MVLPPAAARLPPAAARLPPAAARLPPAAARLPPAAARLPPVAHASGSHTLTLPNNSLILRGSVTDGDQTRVQYLWVRDSQSPAAGVSPDTKIRSDPMNIILTSVCLQDVLYGSETQASLYLANLVEGTYLFQLRATDAQGRSGTATATVEVRPGGTERGPRAGGAGGLPRV